MNIYSYVLSDFALSPYVQFLNSNILLYIGIASGVVCIVGAVLYHRTDKQPFLYVAFMGVGFLSISSIFGIIDEAYVNLSHPYNLLHNGIFSFDPVAKVGGTVEVLYYLLLTPFAYNHISLYMGHFVLTAVSYSMIIIGVYKILCHYIIANDQHAQYKKKTMQQKMTYNYPPPRHNTPTA